MFIDGDDGRSLGHAVALEDGDAEAVEELDDFDGQRCATADAESQATAKGGMNLWANCLVEDFEPDLFEFRERFGMRSKRQFVGNVEDDLRDAIFERREVDRIVEFIEYLRDADEYRRLCFLEVFCDRSCGFGECDRSAEIGEYVEFDGFAKSMGPRKKRERTVAARGIEASKRMDGIGDDVVMCQFDAFWHARRAARIQDIGDGIVVDVEGFHGFVRAIDDLFDRIEFGVVGVAG